MALEGKVQRRKASNRDFSILLSVLSTRVISIPSGVAVLYKRHNKEGTTQRPSDRVSETKTKQKHKADTQSRHTLDWNTKIHAQDPLYRSYVLFLYFDSRVLTFLRFGLLFLLLLQLALLGRFGTWLVANF